MNTQTRRFLLSLVVVTVAAFAAIGAAAFAGNGDRPVASDTDPTPADARLQGVRGRIVALDGTPLAGALVTPKSLDIPAKAIPDIAIISGPDGRYEWPLEPGRYRLTVTAGGQQVATALVTVQPGNAATLDFDLKSGG